MKKLEKENNYDIIKDYWISYIELCWIKMLESIKMVKLEMDSLVYLKNNKPSIIENQQNAASNNVKKGIEMLKITVKFFLEISLITSKVLIRITSF